MHRCETQGGHLGAAAGRPATRRCAPVLEEGLDASGKALQLLWAPALDEPEKQGTSLVPQWVPTAACRCQYMWL